MEHFQGVISGKSRTTASRLGTKQTGLTITAGSPQGGVRVILRHVRGVDIVQVELMPWHGSGTSKVLYDGAVSGDGSAS